MYFRKILQLIIYKKKKKNCKFFSVDFHSIDTDILDIHRLMKETQYKMYELIKKIFIVLLTGIVSASNHTK